MNQKRRKILIMAGGTGGHIFPALSIAEELRRSGASVEWLGSRGAMESRIIGGTDIPLHQIQATGLRGRGLLRLLLAPLMIVRATWQALRVMTRVRPDCVLGMGGFVTGPGGVAARLRHIPLVIHEQNAVAGVTNRLLAPIATLVLEAFPATFKPSAGAVAIGNPVRDSIVAAGQVPRQPIGRRPLRLLVLGGSQGAAAINQAIPGMVAGWQDEFRPQILHQAGERDLENTRERYVSAGLVAGADIRLVGFVDDMAGALAWADLVICRSGASTVCELAAAGMPSILIPYPHHKDRQQLRNARWLADAGAALVLEQPAMDTNSLLRILRDLQASPERLRDMSAAALLLAMPDAASAIATRCLEVANG